MEKNTENLNTENLIEKNFEGEVIFKLDKYLMEKKREKILLKASFLLLKKSLPENLLKNTVISKKNILFGNIVSEARLKIGMKEKMNTLLLGKDSVVVSEALLKIWIKRKKYSRKF